MAKVWSSDSINTVTVPHFVCFVGQRDRCYPCRSHAWTHSQPVVRVCLSLYVSVSVSFTRYPDSGYAFCLL